MCHQLTRELRRYRAAIRIQSAWRMQVGLRSLNVLRADFLEQQELERAAAARIRGSLKTVLFRKAIQIRVARTRKRLDSTLIIQQWYRDQQQRILDNLIAAQKMAVAKLRASVAVQRLVRQRLAHRQLLVLKRRREELIALHEQKATVLCSWGRVCVAKLRVQRKREELDERVRREFLLKLWASTKIAAGWRGKLGRDRAKEFRVMRAHRWKALFCKEREMLFYYNQNTGETVWEKPQCLLDLEPKPICSNCSEYLAEFECRECQEFFCTKCFEFIHHGGKRARHFFRMVYDYYGRRKDYEIEPFVQIADNEGAGST